jgi:hypothetical protein
MLERQGVFFWVCALLALVVAGIALRWRKSRSHNYVPPVTSGEVDRIVRRDYPSERVEEVMSILRGYDSGAPHRVRLAALRIAAGDLVRLRAEIVRANEDYRDVLLAGEYPIRVARDPNPFASLPKAEAGKISATDRKQYEEWRSR